MARISVILPTYNRPKMLYRALKSVRAQEYKNYDIWVINDAGEDVSYIAHMFGANYHAHKENKGLSASRNTGIRLSSGHYLAYLDDDDMWYPNHLSSLIEFLETLPHVRAAYTNCYRWYGEELLMYGQNRKTIIDGEGQRQKVACIINLVHERSVLDEIGGFDESLREMEDWDMVIRMSRHLEGMLHVDIYTSVYSKRNASDQLTADQERMEAAWQEIRQRHGIIRDRPSLIDKPKDFAI